ncbi:MAG: glucose-1-phosphate cytidylyltransferase [Chloroflexi bacterium]|nr:glucose-1-phosphate cytidylyltransferase [Chloroflexota bacterium]
MKTVILAGGAGTRLSEETDAKPKPMVEIGGRPVLWHIMKHYAFYGFNEFIVALGYRGDVVRRYFLDFAVFRNHLTIDLDSGSVASRQKVPLEPWRVHLIETGESTNTGGRLLQLKQLLEGERFFLTYGDGVSNINLPELLEFHAAHRRAATVTAVRPPARFGGLELEDDRVIAFTEKAQVVEGWINGGFFVFEPAIFEYLNADSDSLEYDALAALAADDQLRAYRHTDFWQCMDTLRDVRYLQALWHASNPPWKLWD